jgi:hypothetical protein
MPFDLNWQISFTRYWNQQVLNRGLPYSFNFVLSWRVEQIHKSFPLCVYVGLMC